MTKPEEKRKDLVKCPVCGELFCHDEINNPELSLERNALADAMCPEYE